MSGLVQGQLIGAREKSGEVPWFPDWTIDAACLHADPDIFFPKSCSRMNERKAKRLCLDCPVRMQCLTDNLEVPFGIFGGLNERERWRLRGKTGDPHKEGLNFFTALYRNMVRDDRNGLPQDSIYLRTRPYGEPGIPCLSGVLRA